MFLFRSSAAEAAAFKLGLVPRIWYLAAGPHVAWWQVPGKHQSFATATGYLVLAQKNS